MENKKLNTLIQLHKEAQEFLESSIKNEIKKPRFYKDKLTYRDLKTITKLDLKQLKRLSNGIGGIKIDALVKACRGLLNNTTKHQKSHDRKRGERNA